jgi:hypothetical protein
MHVASHDLFNMKLRTCLDTVILEDYGLPDSTCPDFGKHGSG